MSVKARRATQKVTFNKTVVASLKPPPEGRIYYHDTRVPGLAVCVTSTGNRTFYLYRWDNGRPLRQRLGTPDEMTVEQARDMARGLTGESVLGIDIQARKRDAREEMTFGEMFARWMEYSKAHKRTWKEDQRKYDKFLVKWAARRLSTIDSTDVERLHNAVSAASGPYQANRVLELVKSMFARSVKLRLWKGQNSAAPVKKFTEISRERYLLPEEMERFFKALSVTTPDLQDFFRLLLLTGQRRGATQAMKWADMDLAAGLWTVPAATSKNKRSVTVQLAPDALTILRKREKARGESEYVFPSRGKAGHLMEPKKAWAAVVDEADMPGLRIHDLRRTLGSWLATAGVSLPMIGEVLGHTPGSRATNVYARLMPSAVLASVTQITSDILAAGKAKGASNGKAK